MKRNKFNKALKHLKSKKVDEKIKKLEEAAPTNNMSGVYQVSPSAGDAFRLGQPDAPKRFYTKADGTWPAGIPGDPNKVFYDRPAGYWGSGRNTVPEVGEPTKRDFTYADVTANGNTNTDQFIRPSDGKVYTALPEGSENFILGPLVGNYAINHGYDDYTNLGYIQKDTRQFVLLARIQGFFNGADRNSGTARTWDGTASQLTIYNSNFTLEYALWMKDKYEKGNYADEFPFNFSGGIPVERHPSNNSMGSGPIFGTNDGQQSADGDTSGTEQDAPDDNDLDSLDLQGLINKALLGIDIALMGLSILGILFPEPTTSAAGAAGLAALLAKLRRLRALKAAAKAGKFKFPRFPKTPKPKFPKPKFPKPKFPKGKTPKPARRPDGRPFTDPTTGRPITKASPQPKPTPLPPQKPTSKRPFTPGGSNTRPGSKRPFNIPKGFKPSKPANVTTGSGKTPTPKQPKFKFKNPFKPKSKGLSTGADVGATGLKKPGFDALRPDVVGPKGLHKGSKGLLSPKGGGVYSAPEVGVKGPNPLRPGTGGARYTQFGSNPLNPQGGQGGGVVGSVVPKGARGISGIEPQKVVNPKSFQKGSDMFNRIMKGAYPKSKAAERIRQKGLKAGFKSGSGSIEFKNLPNLKMDFDLDFGMYLTEEVLSDDEQNKRLEAMTQDPKFFENLDGIIDTLEDELEISKLFVMLFGDDDGDIQESVITESKVRILREIRQPLREIQELPKTTKLKGYRPNFKGKYSPQNTPDVTASKKSDETVEGYNTSRLAWTSKDKFWKGYETTERMNVIYDRLGHGSQYFDRIVAENTLSNKKMQEHFNILSHEKAMREDDPNYQSPFREIDESETFENKAKDPLFTKVAKKLKKEIDYPKKPAAKGYPNEAPPKVDPNTGYHPKFGKRYKYDKLDPISAKAMAGAPTGDPEIDANVKRQAQKEDWRSELKNLWLGAERGDWKKTVEEGMTTQALTGIVRPAGNTNLASLPMGLTGDGSIDYGNLLSNTEEDPNTLTGDGEYTALTNMSGMFDAPDPKGVGQEVRHWSIADQEFTGATNIGGGGPYLMNTIPGFQKDASRNVSIRGTHTVKSVPEGGGYYPPSDGNVYLRFDGVGSPRFAALKPVDTTEIDTFEITASRRNNAVNSKAISGFVYDHRPMLYYWCGDHPDYKPTSLKRDSNGRTGLDATVYVSSNIAGTGNDGAVLRSNENDSARYRGPQQYRQGDGWRPIHMKPDGTLDNSVSPYIIDYERNVPSFFPDDAQVVRSPEPYSVPIPDWARGKSARYMIYQAASGSTYYNSFNLHSVQFQRRGFVQTPAITKSLSAVETSPFVRVGPTKKNEGGKERKKKVQDIIDSGLEYTGTKFSKDFPVRTRLK